MSSGHRKRIPGTRNDGKVLTAVGKSNQKGKGSADSIFNDEAYDTVER